jgi:hypothetical protein
MMKNRPPTIAMDVARPVRAGAVVVAADMDCGASPAMDVARGAGAAQDWEQRCHILSVATPGLSTRSGSDG